MSISQNFPNIDPTLRLNFQGARRLDPHITFERASIATYVDEDGLIKTAAADEARFDYDPETGESLGLLIEEQRTNLITQSSTNWVNNISEFTNVDNQHVAPDGTTTASDISETTTNSQHYATTQGFSITSGSTYTFSFFAKNIDRSSTSITITTGGGFTYTILKYFTDDTNSTQVLANSANAIHTKENYGNGWYRFSLTLTATSTTTSAFYVDFRSLNGGVGSTNSMAVWGFQMEAGAFPTSYIPTSGSTVTRQPDDASITGTNFTNFYNQSEGTLSSISSIDYLDIDNQPTAVLFNNSANFIGIGYRFGGVSSGLTGSWINYGGDQFYKSGGNILSNIPFKQSITYKINDAIACVDGTLSSSDNNVILPFPNSLYIGKSYGGYNMRRGHIRSITYYPERLTDTQLQNLTK